jgi:predicted amidohydrolase
VEHAFVHPQGRHSGTQLGVYDDTCTAGLSRLASVIRAEGAVACLQISHAGARASTRLTGLPVVAPSAGVRVLDVAIDDYQFDGYQNAKFWYLFNVRVIGPDGKVIAQSAVQDKQVIQGTVWGGAKGGVERDLPGLYAAAIRKLVRDNPTISSALSAAQPSQ